VGIAVANNHSVGSTALANEDVMTAMVGWEVFRVHVVAHYEVFAKVTVVGCKVIGKSVVAGDDEATAMEVVRKMAVAKMEAAAKMEAVARTLLAEMKKAQLEIRVVYL
jgi:hypothetical protein